jgi:predicted dehydrogenase
MTPSILPIGISVVGYGYWGPNMVRNVVESRDFELISLCERDELRIAESQRRHPVTEVEREFDAVLCDSRVDAVAIATPPATHFPLVRKALEAGKHVLVEKPLAMTSAHAVELIKLAERMGLVLMPGHTFLYSPPVNKVLELVKEEVLGDIHFVTSSRMNLGRYQQDGVVWDLAPHDLSILSYWLGESLVEVSAKGRSVFQDGVPETAFLNLTFASGTAANVQISWLAPRKIRQMVVVGSRRMVLYEDTSGEESVRVYDRGLDFDDPPSNFGEYQLTYRSGDMVAPRIQAAEPLSLELEDLSAAIATGRPPRSNAQLGLEIVQVLEAAHASLELQGQPVAVGGDGHEPAPSAAVPAGASGNGSAHNGAENGHPNGNGHANSNGHRSGNGHSNGNGHSPGNGTDAHAPSYGNGHRPGAARDPR